VLADNIRRQLDKPNNSINTDALYEARRKTESLEREVGKLFLIVEALWTIIKKQNNLSDEYLTNLVNEIDAQDGNPNGQKSKEARPDCPKCGRKVIGNNKNCLWCGAEVKLDPLKRY
jgi:DNA-directed RNA polymerase subunit RPC12/RpoP